MGRALRDLHRRKRKKISNKLSDLLSRADDVAFLQMAWAVDTLQSKSGVDVRRYLNYPSVAHVYNIDSPYFVFKWDIETLIILLLSTSKHKIAPGPNRILDCSQFGAMAQAVNMLRSLENSEFGARIDGGKILLEMHRIGQRQFGWQRGFASSERLYRFTFIYGQGECASYFAKVHGLTIEQFMEVSFVLFAHLRTVPWTNPPDIRVLELESGLMEKVLSLIYCPLSEMRSSVKSLIIAASHRNPVRIAYLPSALRRFPIIRSSESGRIISPLPDLIIFRATAGLYYDLRSGPQNLLAESNNRFEEYTRKIVQAFFPRFEVLPSERYGPKKALIDTPDVMLSDRGQIVAVIECKATKLTYEAQFAENPVSEAERAYAQIAKGAAQLWKFFSHVRRGIYRGHAIADNAHGVILTMESWVQMSRELQNDVLLLAKSMIEDDNQIIESDMRPLIFCSIQDLVDVMFVSNEDQFLASMANAEMPKYSGRGFREVRRDTDAKEETKVFPLKIEELLPWWGRYGRDASPKDGTPTI